MDFLLKLKGVVGPNNSGSPTESGNSDWVGEKPTESVETDWVGSNRLSRNFPTQSGVSKFVGALKGSEVEAILIIFLFTNF